MECLDGYFPLVRTEAYTSFPALLQRLLPGPGTVLDLGDSARPVGEFGNPCEMCSESMTSALRQFD